MSTVATGFTSGFDAQIVRAWIADDPDPVTRAELTALLEAAESAGGESAAAHAELLDRFSGPLEFGTAGLRGEVAAGPHRMNRAVVIRAAAGLSAFLAAHTPGRTGAAGEAAGADSADATPFSVVVGCDARYGSADFARDTAAVVTAAGGRALLLPEKLPTPVLAFAVQHLGADAGVMVTASHNPARDNGYKVYLGARPLRALGGEESARVGAGAQIVPPADALIAQQIAAVRSVAGTPRAQSGWEQLDAGIVAAYLAAVASLQAVSHPEGGLRIVTTSLHGVGAATLETALHTAGFADVHPTLSQRSPDPDFPTVAFPNPEEDGALDEALSVAASVRADLIIANDPDADRFSAAIPTPAGWHQLSGDEVGILLGEDAAARLTGAAAAPDAVPHAASDAGAVPAEAPVLVNSIVSSRGLAAVAAHHGLRHRSSLTGFKWISRVPGIAYGYEEALGYCTDPTHVRDKDGISAAVLFAAYASRLRAGGSTVADELVRIRARDGVFRTQPLTFRLEDTSLIAAGMALLRARPPAELAGSRVTTVADLALGYEDLAATDGMLLLTERDRIIVRPSGTEPKLKCYLEAVEPVAAELTSAPSDATSDPSAHAASAASGASATAQAVDAAWAEAGRRLTEMAGELRAFFRL